MPEISEEDIKHTITTEMFISEGDTLIKMLKVLLNKCQHSKVIIIFKKDNISNNENYSYISLLSQ